MKLFVNILKFIFFLLILFLLGSKKDSYMRRQGTVDKKDRYHKERGGIMLLKDFAKAREYGEKAKKKYFQTKEKK